jgi:hypothetical protein
MYQFDDVHMAFVHGNDDSSSILSVFHETKPVEMVMHIMRVVIVFLPLGLHPAPVCSSNHSLVLVLPPEWRHHMVLLEKIARFVHQCRVPTCC